jgi:L-ascorbate metabolism protein UlaG (beta-lactamase superfamily)
MQLGPVNVLVDPFFSRSEKAVPVLPVQISELRPDAIFVTHGHLDHAVDVPTIASKTGAAVYASMSVCEALHDAGCPTRQLHPLAAGRRVRLRGLRVRAIPARHSHFDALLILRALWRIRGQLRSVVPFAAYPCGDVLGYLFETPQGQVLHYGSIGWYPGDLDAMRPDVALLPMQGRSRVHDILVRAIERLRPRWVIPHHYDDFWPPLSEQIPVQPLVDRVLERRLQSQVLAPSMGEWIDLF